MTTHLKVSTWIMLSLFILASCGQKEGQRGSLSGQGGDGDLSTQSSGGADVSTTNEPVGSTATTGFYCTVTPSKSVLEHGELFTLNISAAGGTAPYNIPGYVSGFFSATALMGGYYNSGTSDLPVSRTLNIFDAKGYVSSCSFSVIVKPVASVSNLACTLTATPAVARLNQPVELKVTAMDGNPFYAFGNIKPQAGSWSVRPGLVSNTEAKANVVYVSSGTRTASTSIVDSAGNRASCDASISVTDPRLVVSAFPSTTIRSGLPLSVSAYASDFDASVPISYSFVSLDPQIRVTPNGNMAMVENLDLNERQFLLAVSASNTLGQRVEKSLWLRFTSAIPPVQEVSCRLVADTGAPYRKGSPIVLRAVNDTNSNPIQITSFEATNGYCIAPYSNPITHTFNASGIQLVSVLAKNTITGRLCNLGQPLTLALDIKNPLMSCDVIINPNESKKYRASLVTGRVPSGQGTGPFDMTVQVDQNTYSLSSTSQPLEKQITFTHAAIRWGSWYHITLRVRDTSDGSVATCDRWHHVMR